MLYDELKKYRKKHREVEIDTQSDLINFVPSGDPAFKALKALYGGKSRKPDLGTRDG